MEREKLIPLVQAVQAGKPDAAGELYASYYREIYYFIYKTVQDTSLAEDLTQDTFLEILETIGRLQEPAAFVKWSHQIAYHRCTGYFKKRRELLADENEDGSTVFDTVAEDREEFIPDEAMDHQELRRTIQSMVDALPEEQRSAILLRYFEELSVKDIAQIQGVSEGTVKSRLNYGRKAIQASVESWERSSGVKLRCAGVLPLLLWLFRQQHRGVTRGRLGKLVSGAKAAAPAAAGTGAAAGTAAAVSGAAKAGAGALLVKIAAVVAAAAVVIGGVAIGTQVLGGGDDSGYHREDREDEDEKSGIGAADGVVEGDPIQLLSQYSSILADLTQYEEALSGTYGVGVGDVFGYRDAQGEPLTTDQVLRMHYDSLTQMEAVDALLEDEDFLAENFPELIGAPGRQELLSRFALLEDVMVSLDVQYTTYDNNYEHTEYSSIRQAYNAQGVPIAGVATPWENICSAGYVIYFIDYPYDCDADHAIPYRYGLFGQTDYLYQDEQLSYQFDGEGKLLRVQSESGTTYTLNYDENGRLVQQCMDEDYGRVVTIDYTYDENGRLVSAYELCNAWHPLAGIWESTQANQYTFAYDDQGRLSTIREEIYTEVYTQDYIAYVSQFLEDPAGIFEERLFQVHVDTINYGSCMGYTPGLWNHQDGSGEQVDGNGQASFQVLNDDRSWKNDEGDVLLDRYYQQVVILEDTEAAKKINACLEAEKEEFFSYSSYPFTNVAEAEAYLKDTGYDYGMLQHAQGSVVTYNCDGIFSVRYYTFWFMSSDSHDETIDGVTFDLNTGEVLTIADLVQMDEETVRGMVVDAILVNIQERINPERLMNDPAAVLKTYALEDFRFAVMEDGQIVVYFDMSDLVRDESQMEIYTGILVGQTG